MITFDAAHTVVHYPADRRFRIWIKPSFLAVGSALVVVPLLLAWIQRAMSGLPYLPPVQQFDAATFTGVHGFPWWLRWSHFFNFVFLMMLVRSGLSILMDHPRLYFNNGCTPGTEWIRFTPLKVSANHVWRASDDDRYISPMVATPGYRHSVGIARSWHFIDVYGFILVGIFFIPTLFVSGQWQRVVPDSWTIVPQAWATFVHYANGQMPPEPNGFYAYNALQEIAYFFVVFVFAPLSIVAGAAMSPAMANHYPWFPRLFGGRQGARSIHFLMMLAWVGFLLIHVALVALTGFTRNMNHIVLGTNDTRPIGMILGFVGLGATIASWIAAHYISWKAPRLLQHAQKFISLPLRRAFMDQLRPRSQYSRSQISPHFWSNGTPPVREDWKALQRDNFRDYRLKIGGLVQNPVELSLAQLHALETEEHITMHHCIQGWSGIAQWNGVSMKAIIQLVRPETTAQTIAFFSYSDDQYGNPYYDTQSLENVLKPQCILAYEMNGQALPDEHGAPLRLRVENQLGYKMVKWIERIEFIESEKELGQGEGGAKEDAEYFDLLPNI